MKILHFIYGLNIGGAETFINNLVKNSPSGIDHYFVIQNPNITNPSIKYYIDKRKKENLYIIPPFPKASLQQYNKLKHLIMDNDFNWLHIHVNSLINPIPLIVSKRVGINTIVHSHNSNNAAGGSIGKIIHHLNKNLFLRKNVEKVACSEIAGEWMFANKNFRIINNAIDLKLFEFSEVERNRIRAKYSIDSNSIVIGSVGRLHPQKNFNGMLDIFAKYHTLNNNSFLLLVGDGPIIDELKQKTANLKLERNIIFAGSQSNPAPFYSAMDCFLMPSLFEGLGFTAIEAQASGLPVVASTGVPEIVNVSGGVSFIDLKDPLEKWAKTIEDKITKFSSKDRLQTGQLLKGSSFDIEAQINNILNIYNN